MVVAREGEKRIFQKRMYKKRREESINRSPLFRVPCESLNL